MMPADIAGIFVERFWQMGSKCRGIGNLVLIDPEFAGKVMEARRKLRELGLLPDEI